MKTELKIAALVCTAAIGIVGCGGSSTPAADVDPVVPEYATLVEADAEVAETALNLVSGGMDGRIASLEFEDADTLGLDPTVYPTGVDPSEESELNITMPCAYEGNYTLEIKNSFTEMRDIVQGSSFAKITFDQCVHNRGIFLGEFVMRLEDDAMKYSYSGIRSMQRDFTEMDGIWSMKMTHIAENFTGVASDLSGKKYREVAMNMSHSMEKYEAADVRKKTKNWNGTTVRKIYNEEGILDSSRSLEFINFEFKKGRVNNQMTAVINGYEGITEIDDEGNITEEFIYGENFTEIKSWVRTDSGTIRSESYDGVLGTHCFGGAVNFETSVVWETNSSQPDINGDEGTTPYVGTLTVNGASESVAVVNFATNDANESFGTITVDGVESDPMTRPEMSEGAEDCEVTIGGR